MVNFPITLDRVLAKAQNKGGVTAVSDTGASNPDSEDDRRRLPPRWPLESGEKGADKPVQQTSTKPTPEKPKKKAPDPHAGEPVRYTKNGKNEVVVQTVPETPQIDDNI